MSNWDYGRGFEGLVKLAYVGIAALCALIVAIPVAVAFLTWWAFHHVAIR